MVFAPIVKCLGLFVKFDSIQHLPEKWNYLHFVILKIGWLNYGLECRAKKMLEQCSRRNVTVNFTVTVNYTVQKLHITHYIHYTHYTHYTLHTTYTRHTTHFTIHTLHNTHTTHDTH